MTRFFSINLRGQNHESAHVWRDYSGISSVFALRSQHFVSQLLLSSIV